MRSLPCANAVSSADDEFLNEEDSLDVLIDGPGGHAPVADEQVLL